MIARRCGCPFCVRPIPVRRAEGLLGRWMTVDASRLYKILNLRAMCDEVLDRDA